jgi:hypothetical protein
MAQNAERGGETSPASGLPGAPNKRQQVSKDILHCATKRTHTYKNKVPLGGAEMEEVPRRRPQGAGAGASKTQNRTRLAGGRLGHGPWTENMGGVI